MTNGINFAWYLNIWMNVLKNDEAVFWSRMTPARCMAIYREYFSMAAPGRCARQAPVEQPARLSLSQYLMGGGG